MAYKSAYHIRLMYRFNESIHSLLFIPAAIVRKYDHASFFGLAALLPVV